MTTTNPALMMSALAESALRIVYDPKVYDQQEFNPDRTLPNMWENSSNVFDLGSKGVQITLQAAYPGTIGPHPIVGAYAGGTGWGGITTSRWQDIIFQYRPTSAAMITNDDVAYFENEENGVRKFVMDLMGHDLSYKRYQHLTAIVGTSGRLFRVSDATPTVIANATLTPTNTTWRFFIDTDTESREWMQTPFAANAHTDVQLIIDSDRTVVDDGGSPAKPYRGKIINKGRDRANGTAFVDIQFTDDTGTATAMANTASDISELHSIRLQAPAGALHKVGLVEAVGDSSSVYFDEDAVNKAAVFPFCLNERGIDPALSSDWNSHMLPMPSGPMSVTTLDEGALVLMDRGLAAEGFMGKYTQIIGPEGAMQLVQELRETKRLAESDGDLTKSGYKVMNDGRKLYIDPFLPSRTMYMIYDGSLLCNADEKKGLSFVTLSMDRAANGETKNVVFTKQGAPLHTNWVAALRNNGVRGAVLRNHNVCFSGAGN